MIISQGYLAHWAAYESITLLRNHKYSKLLNGWWSKLC